MEEIEQKPYRKSNLLPQFESEINDYLSACTEIYTKTQQRNIRFRCSGFMRFLQNRGLTAVSDLGYEDIQAFHEDVPHGKRASKIIYESSIKMFLSHLSDKGLCSYGLRWFLHYLQSSRIVTVDAAEGIPCEIQDSSAMMPLPLSAEEYRSLSENLLSALKDKHMSGNIISAYENAFRLHYIFLDMNGLDYSPAMANSWAEAAKGIFNTSWPTVRRAMCLFNDYARTGMLILGKTYTSKPSGFDLLPQWCKTPIAEFVGQREKAKMSPSTIHMDVASCVRFFAFLSEAGIPSSIFPLYIYPMRFEFSHKDDASVYSSLVGHFQKSDCAFSPNGLY